jgi:hypothetical protein
MVHPPRCLSPRAERGVSAEMLRCAQHDPRRAGYTTKAGKRRGILALYRPIALHPNRNPPHPYLDLQALHESMVQFVPFTTLPAS